MSDKKAKKGSGKRGATVMPGVTARRSAGDKIPLELDRNGIPTGDCHTTLSSWIGRSMKLGWPCYASQKIPKDELQILLKEVLSPFEYPEGELDVDYIVKKMSKSHKDWRFKLRRAYRDGDTYEQIVARWPSIKEEEWVEFVNRTENPKFKEKSDKAKQSREANQYAVHNLSRKGYDGLKKQMMDETYEELKMEAEDRGLPPPDRSAVPEPGRETMWRVAHSKKDGTYLSQAAREIGEQIKHFSQQQSQGKFVPEGRKDVLVMAFGKDEHPGRVRGESARHTWSSYFGRAPYPHGKEKCANVAKMSKAVPTPPRTHCKLSKAFPTPSASTSAPSQDANLASLCITNHGIRQVVAYGKVTQNRKVHGRNLTDDQVSVMLVDFVPTLGFAPLPYGTDEMGIVSQAKGSFVIWDKSDVDFVETMSQEARTSVDRLNEIKDAYFMNREVQELTIPAAAIDMDVVDSFTMTDVTDISLPTTWLSGQLMNIALNKLFILCEARGHRHICFASSSFTHEDVSNSHASRYIRDRLRAGDVVLCPVSMTRDHHWALVAIFKATGHAYVFDSSNKYLKNTLPIRVKDHFEIGYEKFAGDGRDLTWLPKPSPQQKDGWKCVMWCLALCLPSYCGSQLF